MTAKPRFKAGDEIVVHPCPRQNTELGWTGTVTKVDADNMVWVNINQKGYVYWYNPKNIMRLSKLAKALK